MKKGINAWCFPSNLTLEEVFKMASLNGFEGIEINMFEDNEQSIKMDKRTIEFALTLSMGENEYKEILLLANKYNIKISSISTSLLWASPLTDNNEEKASKGKYVVKKMIEAAKFLNAETVLVVPGVVNKETSYDVVYNKAVNVLKELAVTAKENGVIIGVENVWNKFLLSPLEANQFLNEINSDYVKMYFDAGNILLFGYPEQWVHILKDKITKVHIKDFDCDAGNWSGFRNLLQGDMDYKSLIDSLKEIGYDSYISPEIGLYKSNPTQTIVDTAKAMDYILSL